MFYPIYPLKFVGITSAFRPAHRPNHTGVDFGWNRNHGGPNHDLIAVCDAKIIAIKDGIADGKGTSYGNYILMQSTKSGKYSFLYGHILKGSLKVKVGDIVKEGQVLAKMGNSGNSTGTHLHFEVRINNVRVNPLDHIYLLGDETISSTNTYKLLKRPEPEPIPTPTPDLVVGDTVKIIGAYAESSKSTSSRHTRMVGYTRTVVGVYPGTNFPYRIGTLRPGKEPHTIGFAKKTALEKL